MSETLIKVPPLKPYGAGKVATTQFGGPAQSPRDVLERTRVTLSPRGAWSSSGWTSKNKEGHGRCLLQCFKDVDGEHVKKAEEIMLKAIREKHGKKYSGVAAFNDSPSIKKHDVLGALDLAIEMA